MRFGNNIQKTMYMFDIHNIGKSMIMITPMFDLCKRQYLSVGTHVSTDIKMFSCGTGIFFW